MQQHGFARNVDWSIGSTSADPQPDERDPEVTLVLTDSEYSRAMWCAQGGASCAWGTGAPHGLRWHGAALPSAVQAVGLMRPVSRL